jgi:rare lipoprotein A (peptidoglycan hydrolase)
VKQIAVRIPLLSLVLFSLGLSAAAQTQEGLASWYGPGFHGKRTASGEVYDKEAFTAAHKSLPFGTYIRVRSLDTGAGVVVRINDRGPFVEGRIIDLSEAAARMLGMIQSGTARVSIEVIPKDEALAWRGANPDGSIPREISEAPVPAKSGETGERVRIQVASYAQESNAKATLQRLRPVRDRFENRKVGTLLPHHHRQFERGRIARDDAAPRGPGLPRLPHHHDQTLRDRAGFTPTCKRRGAGSR